MAMTNIVIDDIRTFLAQPRTIPFMNERDLQMHLAIFLTATTHYDRVEVEYYVPKVTLGNGYVWENEMKVDIVVVREGEYVPIELKYKTREIPGINIDRFGEVVKGVQIVKNQSAQNEAKYAFWKDVRRLELLKNRYKAVPGGLALFLTNDPSYQNTPRLGTNSYTHSIESGRHDKKRAALGGDRLKFEMGEAYTITWSGEWAENIPDRNQFEYILLKV